MFVLMHAFCQRAFEHACTTQHISVLKPWRVFLCIWLRDLRLVLGSVIDYAFISTLLQVRNCSSVKSVRSNSTGVCALAWGRWHVLRIKKLQTEVQDY
jgi:hypothetical protein